MTLARKRRPSYADVVASNSTTKTADTLKSNVKVVVRIRPQSRQEVDGNSRCVVKAMNEHVLVFDPMEQSSPEYGYRNRHRHPRDIRKRQCKDMKFAFDYVYGPKSTSSDVYETTTKQILDGLLDGYNCSVFAYGATGAGKTHTMLGNPQQPGVIYLTMMDLFARMKALEAEKTCDVAVSYLEVYNEQIRDLLVRGSFLPVRETPDSGVVIQGLSLHKPKTAEELLHMLQFGNENRTQHPTDANAESSRSHAVFQVYARQKDRTANISAEMRVAKMCLVDLAGSERATVTKNRGTRFREGANINRSLLALGNVINALADSKSKGHVPYRDSKLTRLLKDSLGGNCQTIMIAAVSPSSLSYEDTYNTLKYADRAKHIQASLKKNVMNIDFHVTRYGKIVEELRQEIVELKAKVQMYEVGKGNGVPAQQLVNPEITRMKQKMESVYSARLGIFREVLDPELKTRDLMWKIMRKERCLSRMSILCEAHHGTRSRIQQMISASQQRCKSLQEAKRDKISSLNANTETLEQLKASVNEQDQNDIAVQSLKINQQLHETSLSLTESQYCIKYLTKVVKAQERELAGSERLTVQLLQVVKHQHCLLKRHNLLTSDLETYYENIQTMVEGREVCFADQNESVLASNGVAVSDVLDLKSLSTDTSNLCSASSSIQHMVAPSSDIVTTSEQGPRRVFMNKTAFHSSNVVPGKSSWCNGNSKVSRSDSVIDKNSLNSSRNTVVHSLSETSAQQESNLTVPSSTTKTFMSSDRHHGDNSSCRRNTAESTPFPKTSLLHNQHEEKFKRNVMNSCIDSYSSRTEVSQSVETLSGTKSTDTAARQPNCLGNTSVLLSQKHPVQQNTIGSQSHLQASGSVQKSLATCSQGSVADKPIIPSTKSVRNQSHGQVVRNPGVEVTGCNNVNQDLNSTFTLQEGYRENPCVGSKTPIIGNKYSPIRHSEQTLKDSCNTVVSSQNCTKENTQNAKEVKCLPQNEQKNVVCLQNLPKRVEVLPSSHSKKQEAVVINSQTITKENPSIEKGDTKTINKGHCVRSLAFEGMCTPQSGRSYAAVAATPPDVSLTRKPLCHLNVNTTPLAIPMTQASPKTSDGKENCPISKSGSSKPSYGRNIWDEEMQRNTKNLHRMGMLSVTDRANKNITDQSKNTPSYMKMTKSANQRSKFKSRLYQRSHSVSSLPRPGWQH